MKYAYYTQTEGFEECKISLSRAVEIVQRFRDIESATIKKALHDPDSGEVFCSDKVRVWAYVAQNKINRG